MRKIKRNDIRHHFSLLIYSSERSVLSMTKLIDVGEKHAKFLPTKEYKNIKELSFKDKILLKEFGRNSIFFR